MRNFFRELLADEQLRHLRHDFPGNLLNRFFREPFNYAPDDFINQRGWNVMEIEAWSLRALEAHVGVLLGGRRFNRDRLRFDDLTGAAVISAFSAKAIDRAGSLK